MSEDKENYWVTCVKDNRIQGLLRELHTAIEECEDEHTLWQAGRSVRLGAANHCDRRREQLQEQRT